jgi:hypothetical protein
MHWEKSATCTPQMNAETTSRQQDMRPIKGDTLVL